MRGLSSSNSGRPVYSQVGRFVFRLAAEQRWSAAAILRL
jgi:hypothetical protein